jgi:hypothetical protein
MMTETVASFLSELESSPTEIEIVTSAASPKTAELIASRRLSPMGILDFLFGRDRGPDGSTPEKSIVVKSVAEEYQWMRENCRGFKPGMQALEQINGKPYDVLTWQTESGDERKVYFDISHFFGR